MHLAIVCDGLVPHNVSGEQACSLAHAFAERGHRVTLLCAAVIDAQIDRRVTLIHQGRRLPRSLREMLAFRRWVTAERDKLKADHVVSVTPLVAGDVQLGCEGTASGYMRALCRLHGPLPVRVGSAISALRPGLCLRALIEKKTLAEKAIKTCFVTSPLIASEYASLLKDATFDIETIAMQAPPPSVSGTAVDHLRQRLARGLGTPESAKWIVFPFNSAWIAGIEPLLLAFRSLIDQGMDAVLLLAGPCRYTHLAWIAQLGLRDHVRFVGQPDDPSKLYAAADLVVQPTAYDPVGLATLAALACGTPVVTSCASGAAGRVAEQGGVVLQAPVAASRLAKAISDSLDNGQTEPQPPLQTPANPEQTPDWLAQRVQATLSAGRENSASVK